MPRVLLPAAFCSANLIIYWGGFDTTWKLALAMLLGLGLFAIGAARGRTGAQRTTRNALWIVPWLGGHVLLGAVGRYGAGARNLLPDWVDLAVVVVFALSIFYWAVRVTLTKDETAAAVAKDAQQIDYTP